MKTLKTMVVREDIHDEDYDMWRHSLEDYGVRRHSCFVVSFSSLLSHRNHRTVKWGPSEQSLSDWCDAQPKSFVFERRQWEKILSRVGWVSFACNPSQAAECVWNPTVGHVSFLSDPGSFRTYHVGLPPGYKLSTPYTINWWRLRVSAQLLSF